MLVFGPLADFIDIDSIIIFAGIMMIIITFSLLFNKSLILSGQRKQG